MLFYLTQRRDLDELRQRVQQHNTILADHTETLQRLDRNMETQNDTLRDAMSKLSLKIEDLKNWRKMAGYAGGSIGGGVVVGLLAVFKHYFGG